MTLRIGSLCTGYAGLDGAVIEVLGGDLAFVADNDPGKSAILTHRFPDVPNLGDLEAVDWSAVEPVDVLTAGFPCTDISCAGRRAGLRKGNRSGVWHFVARAISELRPPLVVIENVKELLSERADSDVEPCPWCMGDTDPESSMRALGAVLADLAEIGFDAEWVSVPAASAGACHLRWRVFILAWPAADAYGARGRQVTRGTHGDEGPDAGRTPRHHHRPGGDGANLPADAAGARQARGEDPGADRGDAGARELRGAEPQRGGGERAPADPEGIGEREPADEADAIPGGRGPWAVSRGRDGGTADGDGGGLSPDAGGEGLEVRAVESDRDERPAAERGSGDGVPSDSAGIGRGPGPRQQRRVRPAGREPGDSTRGPWWADDAFWQRPGAFGRYEAAVRHHERVFGRLVPAPVATGAKDKPRLSPRFSEWMMGLPDGWVTDVPGLSRNAKLTAIGDGVVPAQAAMALRLLLDRAGIPHLIAANEGAA